LQEEAENYIMEMFIGTQEVAIHVQRQTIMPKDMFHVGWIWGHSDNVLQHKMITQRWKIVNPFSHPFMLRWKS